MSVYAKSPDKLGRKGRSVSGRYISRVVFDDSNTRPSHNSVTKSVLITGRQEHHDFFDCEFGRYQEQIKIRFFVEFKNLYTF